MKHLILITILLAGSVPALADDCLDGAVRFRSFADTGGGEVYLGTPDLGVASNRVERNLTWDSTSQPQTRTITFQYDRDGNARARVPSEGIDVSTTTPVPADINTLLIQVADRDADSSVELTGLAVNGQILGDFSGQGVNSWAFPVDPANEYLVEAGLRYSGPFSNSQELSRVEIRLGNDECGLLPPEPPESVPVNATSTIGMALMTAVMLISGLLITGRRG